MKVATSLAVKTRTKQVPDVVDAGWSADSYITADQLSEEYKIPREAILQMLDSENVWPIAKVVNRKLPTEGHPTGVPIGGRPKMAFDPEGARAAIDAGIEGMFNK